MSRVTESPPDDTHAPLQAGWAAYRPAEGQGGRQLYFHQQMQEFSWEPPSAQEEPTMRIVKLRRGLNGRVGCEVCLEASSSLLLYESKHLKRMGRGIADVQDVSVRM